MNIKIINDIISYIPATNEPLSADVGIIKGDKYIWLFDVGNDITVANQINEINGIKNVIISHFHADHMGNLQYVNYEKVFGGGYTINKISSGITVTENTTINDGVEITLFPIPSTHSKGCVGLQVNNEYAFVGDATYATRKNGKVIYNVSLLRETIVVLENIKAEKLLLSHKNELIESRENVISELKQIYSMRIQNEAYIVL